MGPRRVRTAASRPTRFVEGSRTRCFADTEGGLRRCRTTGFSSRSRRACLAVLRQRASLSRASARARAPRAFDSVLQHPSPPRPWRRSPVRREPSTALARLRPNTSTRFGWLDGDVPGCGETASTSSPPRRPGASPTRGQAMHTARRRTSPRGPAGPSAPPRSRTSSTPAFRVGPRVDGPSGVERARRTCCWRSSTPCFVRTRARPQRDDVAGRAGGSARGAAPACASREKTTSAPSSPANRPNIAVWRTTTRTSSLQAPGAAKLTPFGRPFGPPRPGRTRVDR